jgi:hypothetical protein
VCEGISKLELAKREEKAFLCGLDKNTTLKFASEGVSDYKIIYKRIKDIENILMENLQFGTPACKEKDQKQWTRKWCKLHRTSSHNNDECITQMRERRSDKKNNYKDDKKERSKINNVNYSFLSTLHCKFKNSLINTEIMLDTGSSISLIRKDIAKKADLNIVKTIIFNARLADNSTMKIDEPATVNVESHTSEVVETVNLYVVEDLNQDLLFGNDVLKN